MLLYAALWFSAHVFQTDTLSLNGVVFDPAAKPLAGVHVHLEEPTQRKQWDTDTRPDGTFRFDKLELGTYQVTIQHEGYFRTSAEVRLESSKTVEFTLAAAETV